MAEQRDHAMLRAWMTTGTCWPVAGWGGLIAGALLLASLFNAGVTNGTNPIEQTAATGSLRVDTVIRTPFVQSGVHEGTNATCRTPPQWLPTVMTFARRFSRACAPKSAPVADLLANNRARGLRPTTP